MIWLHHTFLPDLLDTGRITWLHGRDAPMSSYEDETGVKLIIIIIIIKNDFSDNNNNL